MNPPQPPKESGLTPEQRKALRRIQTLLSAFHRGMITLIFKGEDQRLRLQVVSNCTNKQEALDLARRTLQQVEIAEQGVITTLSNSERKLVQ